jgi:hypothetical protein
VTESELIDAILAEAQRAGVLGFKRSILEMIRREVLEGYLEGLRALPNPGTAGPAPDDEDLEDLGAAIEVARDVRRRPSAHRAPAKPTNSEAP